MNLFSIALRSFLLLILFVAAAVNPLAAQTKASNSPKVTESRADNKVRNGRLPVIVIPGLIGSELVNGETGVKVWFNLQRAKDDDMRLPVSPDILKNSDSLVPGDILREIQLIRFTPKIDIYQKFLKSLEKDGYREGKIDSPPEDGFEDTFYVFGYDWRRDNVENAHKLLKKMDGIRAKLNRKGLKFDVVAHSMGGLITRYALMYGNADLAEKSPRPDWAGASYFNNIMLVGTPNGGSLSALDSLQNGFSLFGSGKINLPFIRNLSKFDLFTVPSIYQLLPHEGMLRAFDEDLQPLELDIYDPATWDKYGWLAYKDKGFEKSFSESERAMAESYFRAVLARAKAFQAALNTRTKTANPVPIYYLGSECNPTIDGMVILKDSKDGRWKTVFDAKMIKRRDGTKITRAELEEVVFSPGDGVVAKRSLISSLIRFDEIENARSGLVNDLTIVCGEHSRLTGDELIDRSLLSLLNLSVKPVVD